MNILNNLIIFSAARSTLTAGQNDTRHHAACALLDRGGVYYKRVRGVYKGDSEPAIVASIVSQKDDTVVRDVASAFEQESVLALDSARCARLETPRGDLIESLGLFQAVPESEATACDAYTSDNGTFYICKAV